MDLTTARARIHAMFTTDDASAEELDRRLDDLIGVAATEARETNKPSIWRNDDPDTGEQSESAARPNFFQVGHIYAARVGWPDGRERFRFRCESVTTDPETGQPRAHGQHGTVRVDGEWAWVPNPRTYDDWRGGAWTDITAELA